MNNRRRFTSLLAVVTTLALNSPLTATSAYAYTDLLHNVGSMVRAAQFHPGASQSSQIPPGNEMLEVAFSPDAGAEHLVIKIIDGAQRKLRVAAYSFTSKPIAQALLRAKKRGVDVQVVVDKSQKGERYTSATFLANSGIPVYVDSQHAIMHNKYIIADDTHTELGSFNYTDAAAHKNGENALVVWNNASLASKYEADWQQHMRHSSPYTARY